MLLRHFCFCFTRNMQNWLNICLLTNKEPNFDERQKSELKVFNLSKSNFKNCFSRSSKDGSIFECEDDTFSSANIKILYLHKIWVKTSYTNVIHQFAHVFRKNGLCLMDCIVTLKEKTLELEHNQDKYTFCFYFFYI